MLFIFRALLSAAAAGTVVASPYSCRFISGGCAGGATLIPFRQRKRQLAGAGYQTALIGHNGLRNKFIANGVNGSKEIHSKTAQNDNNIVQTNNMLRTAGSKRSVLVSIMTVYCIIIFILRNFMINHATNFKIFFIFQIFL